MEEKWTPFVDSSGMKIKGKVIHLLLAYWDVCRQFPLLTDCPQHFTFALKALLPVQMFIFCTIFQLQTSATIPAA